MIKIIPVQQIKTDSEWVGYRSDAEKTVSIDDTSMDNIIVQAYKMLQGLDLSYQEIGVSNSHFAFTIDRNGQISGYVDIVESIDE